MNQLELKRKDSKSPMRVQEREGVPYLTFPSFEKLEGIRHGFSTRLGGVSRGYFSSLNLSFTRGDEEERVRENFERIGKAMGFLTENLVFSHQTHTTHVQVVGKRERGCGFTHPLPYQDVDGLVTGESGLVLTAFFADCVPLFFVDPKKRVIGLSHSGWRGTAGKIGRETIRVMKEEFGCDPKDILTGVGPSICQSCYEVSEDVISRFRQEFQECDWESLFYEKGEGKYQLNLWKANELVLLEAGITPAHICITDICTCCNPNVLFSHRASGGKRGNLAAFLELTR